MSDDIVMLAMLATIHHRTGADPDKDYTHPYVIENYKYCKDLLCGMVDYARKIEARHNELKEAVAWERECYAIWEYGPTQNPSSTDEAIDAMHAARAEVDRLLEDEGRDRRRGGR